MSMLFYIVKSEAGYSILKGENDKLKAETIKQSHEVVAEGNSLGEVLEKFSKSLNQ